VSQAASVRRVVTGHDADGVANVMIDGQAAHFVSPRTGSTIIHLWNGDVPADIAIGDSFEDMGARKHAIPPPPNGTRFVIIDFPPGNDALMHRTESLDYAIVMAGEIDMDLDDSCVHLKAGDVMVQRGTNHAWFNRGTVMARVAFVLVDAAPLGIGDHTEPPPVK
jgi:quercetin dioxygenase-like cupin family protein